MIKKLDVIIGIISSLREGGVFPSNEKFLHENFFELSKKFPSLFCDFIFDENKRCETVNEAIDEITAYRMAEWKIIEGNYIVLPNMTEKRRDLVRLLSPAETDQLCAAGQMFSEMVDKYYSESEKNKKCPNETCCGRC